MDGMHHISLDDKLVCNVIRICRACGWSILHTTSSSAHRAAVGKTCIQWQQTTFIFSRHKLRLVTTSTNQEEMKCAVR
jgi:hypothetical protein